MSYDNGERIRKAARDGYLDLLRDVTRKECNAPDEDGMTATHWAAYAGNLDALRIIVGRGGDPGKCDNFGNTALHWSANNGHFNCVSFLVSFGVNLWSLDNEYHTAKETAAINNREDVVQFLDHVIAKQSALNTKIVQKMKEKSLSEAEKRVKLFQKMQSKTTKKIEKEEKQRQRQREKSQRALASANQDVIYSDMSDAHIYDTLNTNSKSPSHYNSIVSNSKKFSDLVNSSVKSNKMKILSGVSRKVLIRKQNSGDTVKSSEGGNGGTCRSIQSLSGIRRDDQIVYLPKYSSVSVTNLAVVGLNGAANGACSENQPDSWPTASLDRCSANARLPLKDLFNCDNNNKSEPKTNTFSKNIKTTLKSKLLKFNKTKSKSNLYRTVSEPDFLAIGSNPTIDVQQDESSTNQVFSIFERPGFGSVSFRGKFTPDLMFSVSRCYHTDSAGNSEDDGDSGHDHSSHSSNSKKYYPVAKIVNCASLDQDSFASDSIGSAGSLAQNDCLEEHLEEGDDTVSESKSIPVLLFLYAHGLKEYYEVFESEHIDIDALMLLTEDDLISLGIPLGPRRKLMNAIRQRKHVLQNCSNVFETKL